MQVTGAGEIPQIQPGPAAAVGTRPGGTLSVRVTAPLVEEPPMLDTVMV